MCKPPPGPRCAAHAAAELDDARETAAQAMRTLNRLKNADADTQMWVEQSRTRVDVHAAQTAAVEALRAAEAAQRVYDSTPTGQRKLEKAHAAAEAADDPRRAAKLLARLTVARADRETVMTRWKASSAYSEERLSGLVADHGDNLGDVADRIRALRTEIAHRRAAEHQVLLPPTNQRARTVWETTEPRGKTWRTLADLLNPAAASLTYSDPTVHAAAQRYLAAPDDTTARDNLLAEAAKSLPAALAAPDDLSHHMYRARASGKPWSIPGESLAAMVAARGTRYVDPDGSAATGGQPDDRWRVHQVLGPVQITGGTHRVNVTEGWVCVREHDHLWRILNDEAFGQRLVAVEARQAAFDQPEPDRLTKPRSTSGV